MSAEASVVSGIAGRYATALFELARDRDALDQVATDLAGLGGMIEKSDDLGRLLRSPVIAVEDQERGMAAIMERANASELVANFVAVVAQNRRLLALEDMIKVFRALLAAHHGEVVAEVTSAQRLNEGQIAEIKAELTTAMKTDVQLETAVDEGLLGGMIVRIGSRMVDSSLRTKIQNLRFAMRGVE